MAKVKITLDSAAIREMLKSAGVRQAIEEKAASIVASLGEGHESRTHESEQRVICNVYPTTSEAARKNLKENTLLKALKP